MLNLLKPQRFRYHALAFFKNGHKSTAELILVLWFEKSSLSASLPTVTIARKKSDTPPFQIPPKLLLLKCFQEGIHCTRQPATKEATEAWPNTVWKSIWKLGLVIWPGCLNLQNPLFLSRCNPGPGDWNQHVPVWLLQFTFRLSVFPCSDTD